MKKSNEAKYSKAELEEGTFGADVTRRELSLEEEAEQKIISEDAFRTGAVVMNIRGGFVVADEGVYSRFNLDRGFFYHGSENRGDMMRYIVDQKLRECFDEIAQIITAAFNPQNESHLTKYTPEEREKALQRRLEREAKINELVEARKLMEDDDGDSA